MNPPRKIGIYGGSFDPVHHGHLILAREAMESLGLDRMVFVPAGISPHKLDRPPVSPEIRLEMVEAAIAGEEKFLCDDCEVQRDGPSFAIDTVRMMMARHPGAEMFFLLGEDNLATLHTWKDIETLRSLVRFVVLARGDGVGEPDFDFIERCVDISSTDIRNRIASGASVRYLVPESVCSLISRHRLYRND